MFLFFKEEIKLCFENIKQLPNIFYCEILLVEELINSRFSYYDYEKKKKKTRS